MQWVPKSPPKVPPPPMGRWTSSDPPWDVQLASQLWAPAPSNNFATPFDIKRIREALLEKKARQEEKEDDSVDLGFGSLDINEKMAALQGSFRRRTISNPVIGQSTALPGTEEARSWRQKPLPQNVRPQSARQIYTPLETEWVLQSPPRPLPFSKLEVHKEGGTPPPEERNMSERLASTPRNRTSFSSSGSVRAGRAAGGSPRETSAWWMPRRTSSRLRQTSVNSFRESSRPSLGKAKPFRYAGAAAIASVIDKVVTWHPFTPATLQRLPSEKFVPVTRAPRSPPDTCKDLFFTMLFAGIDAIVRDKKRKTNHRTLFLDKTATHLCWASIGTTVLSYDASHSVPLAHVIELREGYGQCDRCLYLACKGHASVVVQLEIPHEFVILRDGLEWLLAKQSCISMEAVKH